MKKLLLALMLAGASLQIAHAMPAGNYQQTCRKCDMHRGELVCQCQKANHNHRRRARNWSWTSLNNANGCWRVENHNGDLTCAGGWDRHQGKPRRRQENHNNNVRKQVRRGTWTPGSVLG